MTAESLITTALGRAPTFNEKDGHKTTRISVGDLSALLQIKLKKRLRWNLLLNVIELDGVEMPGEAVELFYVLLSEIGYEVREKPARDALIRAARLNEYNPALEYFEAIFNMETIDPIDLDQVATDYLGTDDPLYDAMLAATLIGLVQRTFEPGSKFDNLCTLHGRQGIKKSSFWKAIASPAWFIDTAQPNRKECLQAIHSCLIFEMAELDSVTSAKATGEVKALLSSATDSYQLPYGKSVRKFPRRSIMVATGNKKGVLRDDEHRRFWIIDLPHRLESGQEIDVDRVIADRDRIMRAAVLAYRAGRQPFLPREQQLESERRNRGFEVEHPFSDLLATWVLDHSRGGFTTKQAIQDSGCRGQFDKIEQRDLQDASRILRRLGYYRTTHPERTFDNKRIWFAEEVNAKNFRQWGQQPGGTGASGNDDNPVASDSPAKVADAEDLPQASPSLFEKGEEVIRRGGPTTQLLGNGVRRVAHEIQPLNLNCRF
jgi:predicted P-loop ATPase